ncbi:uncharacterized protein LOC128964807 [Oppia nitens]|uniref:uncharacterized protein LOC128964807 n=1 Tax=Oppia nitens TaxID=1686743 RepID=UPI0023DCBB92|nr:uncharacterized protein LOC128964807 [Oppia nitens]
MDHLTLGQENDMLSMVSTSGQPLKASLQSQTQSSDLKALKTPAIKGKGLTFTKTSALKSSRKAFGNVSNVLRSEIKPSVGGLNENKNHSKTVKKDNTKQANNEMSDVGGHQKQDNVEHTYSEPIDSKYLDDIEEMHPMKEELMLDINDPLTTDLYAIDDKEIFEMQFDSDFGDELLDNKEFDYNLL